MEIYSNFFTIGGLIATLFTALGGGFLLLLKNRSSSTSALGNVFLFFLPVNGAYCVATMIDDPSMAYHRYLTVSGVFLSFLFMTNFALQFPKNDNPKLTRGIFWAQLIGAAGLILYFVLKTWSAGKVFIWTGHIYDFNSREASQIVARGALLYLIIFISVAGYRVYKTKSKERWPLLAISFLLAASMVIPTITNIMSLMGKMTRGTHNMWFVFTTVTGYFAVIIIYINVTKDRTSLMSKIVGTTAVTILLVIQTLSYFALSGAEAKYDRLKLFESQQGLADASVSELRYAVKKTDGELTVLKGDVGATAFKKLAEPETEVSRVYRSIAGSKYVAFVFNWQDGLYEVGYDYADYRSYIDSTAFPISMTAVVLFLALLSAFPYFFRVNLVNPLTVLLQGLSKVNGGDLNVTVPVRVKDEIGYISETFNGMVKSIRDANAKLQDYADHLEIKVKDRTKELEASLEEVRALKHQQDGDYWLTSLLLVPLGTKKIESAHFNVDFYLRQKKQFTFKNRDCEIGGDICIAQTIELQAKKYHIIANCDAMGKALQGASGALVLGSVLEARIERTLVSLTAQAQSPERWLKNAFIELQKVFERFDGSMLMSTILGLIEEDTGTLYYINAEHPNMVVYRGGRAQFIEPERILRKLGTPMFMDSWIQIEVFQMKPGDVLVFGSDGRDDIVTYGEDDSKVMNTDYDKFVDFVAENRGELQGIIDAIDQSGQVSDDLSLIRIDYQAEPKSNLQQSVENKLNDYRHETNLEPAVKEKFLLELLEESGRGDNGTKQTVVPELLKELARFYLKDKQYEAAGRYLSRLIEIYPAETEYIYYASHCMKRTGRLDEAINLGERARMRSPRNVRYLSNLAHAYSQNGDRRRAKKLIGIAQEIEPDSEVVHRLQKMLVNENKKVKIGSGV